MNLYSIPALVTLICFCFLAVLTLVRKKLTMVNTLFFLLCLIGVFLYSDILIIFTVKDEKIALLTSRIDHIAVVYAMPLYMHFFHSYLGIIRRKWLIFAAYASAFILMWFSFTPLLIEKMHAYPFGYYGIGGRLYPLVGIGAAIASLYSLTIICHAIRKEKNSIRKNKLKYIFVGFGTMGFLTGLNVLPLLGYNVYPPGAFSFVPLIIFSFGLFKYDLLDMGVLIKKSLLYAILTAVLTCFYAMAVSFSNYMLHKNNFSDSVYFQILFFSLVVVVFSPIKTRIQMMMDRYFHKETYAFKSGLNQTSRLIASDLNMKTVAHHLLTAVVSKLRLLHCTLYLRDTPENGFRRHASQSTVKHVYPEAFIPNTDPLVRLLTKKALPIDRKLLMEKGARKDMKKILYDMDKLWAELVIPLKINDRLKGFIAIGEKISGNLFSKEEVSHLVTLSIHVVLALENARAYKRLDDLNKNLEQKVQERTVALQDALAKFKKSQEQLIRSESLAAIGQLVAGVAHELNNPIAAALSLIQSTQLDLESQRIRNDQTLNEDISYIAKELGRVKQIVSSLLCLSRQTDSYDEFVNINEVVEDALRILHGQINQNGIQIRKDFQWDIPSIQGNFGNLGQVVINIIKNAYQAIRGKKGTVILTTRYQKDRDAVIFACQDSGSGINPSIQKDIFKPFFTTKPVGQGTGLGLYISHEIIRKHNGSIIHENVAENGSLFKVFLPVA